MPKDCGSAFFFFEIKKKFKEFAEANNFDGGGYKRKYDENMI